jgi:hypothetical protein
VTINPDGVGGDAAVTVGSLDWAVGNTIATPTVAGGNVTNPVVGDKFQVFAQLALGNFQDGNANTIGGLQLNNTYEWTMVAGFREEVVAVSVPTQSADFKVVTGGTNFFEIWYGARNSNALAGTGYNDGTRILQGTILATATDPNTGLTKSGSFSRTGGGVGTNLDGFISDDYPLIDSITGQGSLSFVVDVFAFDDDFFVDPITTLILDYTTEQRLAYNTTNPSALFVNAAGGGAPTLAGATVASIGTCNGCSSASGIPSEPDGGPNEMFQADASTSFKTERIPEPATLALLGVALTGMGFARRRKVV